MTSYVIGEDRFEVTLSGPTRTIVFDATISEGHTSTLTVTQHPVEQGADVTDHARKASDVLELRGIISNTPILILASQRARSVTGGPPSARAEDAYEEFRRLQETVELLTVTTEIHEYEDMVIESISVPRTAGTRKILDIQLRLKKFRVATVESVEAPEPKEPVHKAKRKQGRRQSKEPKTEVQEKSETVLESTANAWDKIRGAGGLF